MEIQISRSTLIWILFAGALLGLFALGHAASPHDALGRPVLLLPEVRDMESYRRQAMRWKDAWQGADAELQAILDADDAPDLIDLSRRAQHVVERTVQVARETDAVAVPPALLGLREMAVGSALAYVEAGAAVARWLSAPSASNRAAADQALSAARAARETFQTSEWVRTVAEPTPTVASGTASIR